MKITQSLIEQIAARLRRENGQATPSDSFETVWLDYETLRTTEFKGDLDFQSYWDGCLMLYFGLDEEQKTPVSPVVYILASYHYRASEGSIHEFIAREFPLLDTPEFHVALTVVLKDLPVDDLCEVAASALASR